MGSDQPLVRVVRLPEGPPSLVLDGPHGNAISPALVDALVMAVDELAGADDAAVLVESANPRAFMVGGDLDAFARWSAAGELAEQWSALAARTGTSLQRLRDVAAFKIGLAAGAAVGGGLELLLMCDHRIAAEGVSLGFPEIRLGVYPAGGSIPALVAAVGRSRALRMVLGGELVDARQALAWGLVDEVVPREQVRPRGLALAAEFAGANIEVLRAVRRELSPGIAPEEIGAVMRGLLGRVPEADLERRIHSQRAQTGGTGNLPIDR